MTFPPRRRTDLELPTGLLLGGAVLAAAGAWLSPNHYPPWVAFHGEAATAVAAVLFASWVLWRSRLGLTRLPLLAVVAFAGALVPLVQYFAGLIFFFGDAFLPSLYLCGFALAVWFGRAVADGAGLRRSLEPLWAVLLFAAVLSTGVALYQWQGLDYFGFAVLEVPPGGRLPANVAQPNLFATLLVLGMVATAFFYETSRIGRGGALAVVAFLGLGLATTQSRAGGLELIVVCALLGWRRRALVGRLRARALWVVVPLLLAILLLWSFALHDEAVHVERNLQDMANPGSRPQHWLTLLDAVRHHPWRGFGWNQLTVAQMSVALDHPVSHEIMGHAHNLLLDLVINSGVPIGLALIAALVVWFWLSLRRVSDPCVLLALAGVVAVFTHAMVELPLHYSYVLLPVGLLMGAVSFATQPELEITVPRWLAPLLLAAASLAIVAVINDYATAQTLILQQRFAIARIGPQPKFEPWNARVLTQLSHFWNYSIEAEHPNMTAEEMTETEHVVRRFPSRENLVRYAAALALNGRGDAAPAELDLACSTSSEASCRWVHVVWDYKRTHEPRIAAVKWPVR